MKTDVYAADRRGKANIGWLTARYYFSFGNFYYDPRRIHFGVLRVINDDIIAAGKGFGEHPHDNMEIITIPLSGALQHKDSLGNTSIIRNGDIQVMSAGKGVYHSEFNPSNTEETKLFQIWLFPNKKNADPRYDQWRYLDAIVPNNWTQILSPHASGQGVWIHQDAWFHLGHFDTLMTSNYSLNLNGNGLFMIVIEGKAQVGDTILTQRDAIGIMDIADVDVHILKEGTRILMLEVPMSEEAMAV